MDFDELTTYVSHTAFVHLGKSLLFSGSHFSYLYCEEFNPLFTGLWALDAFSRCEAVTLFLVQCSCSWNVYHFYSNLDREVNTIWVHIGFSFTKIERNSVPQKVSTQKVITKIHKKSWHLMLKAGALLISWYSSHVSLSGAPGIRQNGSKFYYLINRFSPGLTASGTIKCELNYQSTAFSFSFVAYGFATSFRYLAAE